MSETVEPRDLPPELEERLMSILEGPPELRCAALDATCEANPGHAPLVRRRFAAAEELLRDLQAVGSDLLAGPGTDRADVPDSLGPYRILEVLGEGGMGTVYLAEQHEPIRRRVALKVIKSGMDTRQVLARFEAERQALALMSHEGIARVFDAGRTAQGRPYFAMEYIPGVPITSYCDAKGLTVRERVRLFRKVCAAVQHAHQRGIIHRDLKPSNLLVTEVDGERSPRVIDFGLARAMDQRLTAETFHTLLGTALGTPEYMSPEQAEGSALDLDTRSDIYSLGVVLYELLVGALPFDSGALRRLGLPDLQRTIREVDPKPPSSRITTADAGSSTATAARRRTDVDGLVRALRGDLDWITMKALAKDRAARYQSASELDADLARYLSHEPVLARPPSVRYRLSRFARRYRIQVLAAAAVLVSLVAGLVLSLVLWARAVDARGEAETSAAEAREVARFLAGVFEAAAPYEALGEDISARQLLDAGAAKIRDGLRDQPRARAELLCTLARIHRWLGSYDEAERLGAEGLALQRQLRGAENPHTLEWELDLGRLLLTRELNAEAERYYRALLERVVRALGPGNVMAARGRIYLGEALKGLGALDASGEQYAAAVAILRDVPEEEMWLAEALLYHGGSLRDRGRGQDAIALLEEALALAQHIAAGGRWVNDHALLAALGLCYSDLGRFDDAERCLAGALALAEEVFGPEHVIVGGNLVSYAHFLRRAGRIRDAVPHLRRALVIAEKNRHPDSTSVAWAANDLGLSLLELGQEREAVAHLRRALAIYRQLHQGDNRLVAIAIHNVADALARTFAVDEAEALARESLAMRRRLEPEPGELVARALTMLANVLLWSGGLEEAEQCAKEARALWASLYGGSVHPDNDRLVAMALLEQGRGAEAEGYANRALASYRAYKEDQPPVAVAMDLVGWSRLLLGDRATAATLCAEAVARLDRAFPEGTNSTAFALGHLAASLLDDDPERALSLLRRAVEIRRRVLEPGIRWRIASLVELGSALTARGAYAEAEPLLLEAHRAHDPKSRDARWLADPAAALVRLYEATGRDEDAASFRERVRR